MGRSNTALELSRRVARAVAERGPKRHRESFRYRRPLLSSVRPHSTSPICACSTKHFADLRLQHFEYSPSPNSEKHWKSRTFLHCVHNPGHDARPTICSWLPGFLEGLRASPLGTLKASPATTHAPCCLPWQRSRRRRGRRWHWRGREGFLLRGAAVQCEVRPRQLLGPSGTQMAYCRTRRCAIAPVRALTAKGLRWRCASS